MKIEKQYEAWVAMDNESNVISEEYETIEELKTAMYNTGYFPDIAEADGITLCKVLCTTGTWLECLEEIKPTD